MIFKKNKLANSKRNQLLNKNAFTLIELLAIIVILAIIAVITVPLILGIIDDAKKNSIKDSAYGYTKSLTQSLTTTLLDDNQKEFPNGIYHISENGKIVRSKDLEEFNPNITGNQPTDGWVKIINGQINSYSLKFDDYVVTKNNTENQTVEKSEKIQSICEVVISEREPDGENKKVSTLTTYVIPKRATNVLIGTKRMYRTIQEEIPTKEYVYENGSVYNSTLKKPTGTFEFEITMSPKNFEKRLYVVGYATYTLDGEEYTILSDVSVSEP